MKKFFLSVAGLFVSALVLNAVTIAQWNFNSSTPDNNTGTGSINASAGTGLATNEGGSSSDFASGTTADPAPSDNSGWNTAAYPPATNANKTAGVRFQVDTSGFTNIVVTWAERHSASASKYMRFQTSSDGYSFTDRHLVALAADGTFTNFGVPLAAASGAANNPAFAFRIVSEFEFSATGSGPNQYAATKSTSSYSTGGTVRFDMVTVTGDPIPNANTPPNISTISNQTLRVGATGPPLSFTVWDSEDAPSALTLSATSSDSTVVPEENIVFGGFNAYRTMTITAGYQPGSAEITVRVTDPGGRSSSTMLMATVLPLNTPPMISPVARTNTLPGTAAGPIGFTISDLETPAANLTITAASLNTQLLPAAGIALAGSGSNRTVTLYPTPGKAGVAAVTLSVSDGVFSTNTSFPLLVLPSPEMVFCDFFDYPDGSLVENSAACWTHRSGTDGDFQVTSGMAAVATNSTEDVATSLVGGPFRTTNHVRLYVSLKLKLEGVPKAVPDYLAHFVDGNYFRGRLFVGSTNAWPGCYNLYVANYTGAPTLMDRMLYPGATHTVVMRYNVETASTTVWCDPAAETDMSITATDIATPGSVSSFALRQGSLGATAIVDDLKIGFSFASVTGAPTPGRPRLAYQRLAPKLVLSWTGTGLTLQSAPSPTGGYTDIIGATSPYTNAVSSGTKFYRLKGQ